MLSLSAADIPRCCPISLGELVSVYCCGCHDVARDFCFVLGFFALFCFGALLGFELVVSC